MLSANTAVSAVTRGAIGNYPALGLAMRFEVEVDGLSLGHWHSCEGLKVKLETKPVDEGGEYTRRIALPERVLYEPITLKRAMCASDSKRLQQWLRNYVSEWSTYTNPFLINRTGATVTLLDYELNPVIAWRLHGVYPSSWIGPSLGADHNNVAIETLVLEHEGFLD